MTRRQAFTYLGCAGLMLFVCSAFTPLPNVVARKLAATPRLERGDAIVVLAGGIRQDGTLSDPSLRRAVHGISLYLRGFAPLLVFSGAGRRNVPAEAQVSAELAERFGVPAGVILREDRVRTTREEAVRMRALLIPRQVRVVLLVTDSPHMLRAQRVFEAVGFVVLPAPADDESRSATWPQARLLLMRDILREWLALLYYDTAGYLRRIA